MMHIFYVNALLAILATFMAVTAKNAVHVLLYFILSLLSLALEIYLLGSPFAAALEVIVYAGAILVLFVFVVMLLNVQPPQKRVEHSVPTSGFWLPTIMSLALVFELLFALSNQVTIGLEATTVSAKEVAILMFNRYGVGVEIASMLLLAGLVGAFHVGSKKQVRGE